MSIAECRLNFFRSIAQLVQQRLPYKQKVMSSNLIAPTIAYYAVLFC